jgi:branched-chain amino acid transport system substrate-binding protein
MRRIHGLLGAAVLTALLGLASPAGAQTIKVGEINSYSAQPPFTLPYRNGWQLFVEELNASGGVLGQQLEVISRDDGGKPADAVTFANELVTKDKVVLLAGAFLSNVGLALGDFAKQHQVLYIAAEPLSDAVTWAKGNKYTYRLRPSTYMQTAMLVEEAARMPAKRWALIGPNYEYGQSAIANFKKLLLAQRPDVEFVGEQLPALGKLEAGPTVEALESYRPDAIFNATFGGDLIKFAREGATRGLFKGREVVSLLSGEPEYIDPMKDDAPQGWLVTGYPWYDIDTPAHNKFVKAYQARYNDYPRMGSVVGYATFQTIAAALKKAGSTDTAKLLAAMDGLTIETPIGPVTYRPSDHQATMGAFVGRTAIKDGKPVMVGWKYADGAKYLPSPAETAKLRPQD